MVTWWPDRGAGGEAGRAAVAAHGDRSDEAVASPRHRFDLAGLEGVVAHPFRSWAIARVSTFGVTNVPSTVSRSPGGRLMPSHAFSRVSFNNREAYLVVRR